MAEEETHMLIRKKLETDEEMKKIKSIAMKVVAKPRPRYGYVAVQVQVFPLQSEEEKKAMQRKVSQVEEKAASLLVSSQQTKHERDELKRKLLKVESIDHHTPTNHMSSPSPCTSSSENVRTSYDVIVITKIIILILSLSRLLALPMLKR